MASLKGLRCGGLLLASVIPQPALAGNTPRPLHEAAGSAGASAGKCLNTVKPSSVTAAAPAGALPEIGRLRKQSHQQCIALEDKRKGGLLAKLYRQTAPC